MPKNKRNRHRSKREWRGIDTADIIEERFRQQKELLEGGPLSSRKDEELYFVDKGGKTNKQVASEVRKERARSKVLALDKAIQPNPHTQPLKVGPPPRIKSGPNMNKKRKAPSSSSTSEASKSNSVVPSEFFDLWDGPVAPISASSADSGDSDNEAVAPNPKRRKVPPKPSSLPAVQVAEAGTSYRPTPEDHQELLGKAVAYRLKLQDEKKKLARSMKRGKELRMTTDGLGGTVEDVPPALETETEATNESEKVTKEEADAEAEVEAEHVNQPWSGEKSKIERNREKRRKAHELRRIEALKKKQMKEQLNNLPELLKEVELAEAETQQRRQIREMKKRLEPDTQRKNLGSRNKFEEKEPEYLLTEELPESLRTLPNASKFNLLRDRFQSLQKRNIIEPRVKQQRVYRYQKKVVEKYSTRDPQ